MKVVPKSKITITKEKVHAALKDLDDSIGHCSKETPRAVARVLNELEDAVINNVLQIEEEKAYKRYISDKITNFEHQ